MSPNAGGGIAKRLNKDAGDNKKNKNNKHTSDTVILLCKKKQQQRVLYFKRYCFKVTMRNGGKSQSSHDKTLQA